MLRLMLLALLLIGGCATVQHKQAVCPEYRNLRCLTPLRCSYDSRRGCEVCQCGRLPVPNRFDEVGHPDSNTPPPPDR